MPHSITEFIHQVPNFHWGEVLYFCMHAMLTFESKKKVHYNTCMCFAPHMGTFFQLTVSVLRVFVIDLHSPLAHFYANYPPPPPLLLQVGRAGRQGSPGSAYTFINNSNKTVFVELATLLQSQEVHLPPQLAKYVQLFVGNSHTLNSLHVFCKAKTNVGNKLL